jgi:hypothetical protein
MRKNHYEPPMNADKDKTKSRLRLVFIDVHRRLIILLFKPGTTRQSRF